MTSPRIPSEPLASAEVAVLATTSADARVQSSVMTVWELKGAATASRRAPWVASQTSRWWLVAAGTRPERCCRVVPRHGEQRPRCARSGHTGWTGSASGTKDTTRSTTSGGVRLGRPSWRYRTSAPVLPLSKQEAAVVRRSSSFAQPASQGLHVQGVGLRVVQFLRHLDPRGAYLREFHEALASCRRATRTRCDRNPRSHHPPIGERGQSPSPSWRDAGIMGTAARRRRPDRHGSVSPPEGRALATRLPRGGRHRAIALLWSAVR